jgi:hypothetical protein
MESATHAPPTSTGTPIIVCLTAQLTSNGQVVLVTVSMELIVLMVSAIFASLTVSGMDMLVFARIVSTILTVNVRNAQTIACGTQ